MCISINNVARCPPDLQGALMFTEVQDYRSFGRQCCAYIRQKVVFRRHHREVVPENSLKYLKGRLCSAV